MGTIQQFIESGQQMEVWCHNPKCRHHAVLDMLTLRDRLGPDHGCLHYDLVHKFKCSKCGGNEIGFLLLRGGDDNSHEMAKFPSYKNLYQKAKDG